MPQGGAVALHLREVYTQNAVSGVAVAACPLFDEACTGPIAQTQADYDGNAQITLPASFDGYLQISGSAMPTNLVYVAGRSVGADGLDVDVYTGAALSVTTHLMTPPGDGSGAMVRVDALDCSGVPAPGVQLIISSNSTGMTQSYFVGDGAVLSTGAHETDATGISIGTDAPAGWIGVAAKRSSDGLPVGGAIGFVRPGAVTSVVVSP
jgi:hypothetical protein